MSALCFAPTTTAAERGHASARLPHRNRLPGAADVCRRRRNAAVQAIPRTTTIVKVEKKPKEERKTLTGTAGSNGNGNEATAKLARFNFDSDDHVMLDTYDDSALTAHASNGATADANEFSKIDEGCVSDLFGPEAGGYDGTGVGKPRVLKAGVLMDRALDGEDDIEKLNFMTYINNLLDEEDAIKDAHRLSNRRHASYSFDDWEFHRSSQRYIDQLLSFPTSQLLLGIAKPLTFLTLSSAIVCLYNTFADYDLLASWGIPLHLMALAGPIEPFTLSSPALALMLVFRTNSAFSMWVTGRSELGRIVQRSRQLARQATMWFDSSDSRPGARSRFVRHTVAFLFTLKAHLRANDDLAGSLDGLIAEADAQRILQAKHKPCYVLNLLEEWAVAEARIGGISPQQLEAVDRNIEQLQEAVGSCERVLSTPIPYLYTRFTNRILMIFLLLLPIGMWAKMQWGTVPTVLLMSVGLLGIEDLGVQIEEPFSILNLEVLCERGQASIFEMEEVRAAGNRRTGGWAGNGSTVAEEAVYKNRFPLGTKLNDRAAS